MKEHRRGIRQIFHGNVFFLGVVSFLTDMSSEMIYPLLPAFFTGLVPLSVTALYIGLMEGIAEGASSLLKVFSGRASDRMGKRKTLTLWGYGISCLARPAMAAAMAGWHVIFLRFLDRVGKGIRTSPRDALLSESVTGEVRGLAFSFHRMMDHAGAVSGPLLSAALLYVVLGGNFFLPKAGPALNAGEMNFLRGMFALALLPGLASLFLLKRKVRELPAAAPGLLRQENTLPATVTENKPASFYHFLAAVTLFTLGNSSDLFLVFHFQQRLGAGLGQVILLWVFLHLSKILFSLPGGWISDRFGRKPAILGGWMVYALVYLAIPHADHAWTYGALIFAYGLYYGLTEGAERALVADFVPSNERGGAFGLYHGCVGFASLGSSILFGIVWVKFGADAAFATGAALAGLASLILASATLPIPEDPLRKTSK